MLQVSVPMAAIRRSFSHRIRDSEPGQHLDHLTAAVVGRVRRPAAFVLCFHAVRHYEIAWRSTASAGKFDFSSRTGKTQFVDADFFRGRKKSVRETPGGSDPRSRAEISLPYPLSNRFSRSCAVFREW